MKLDVYVQGDEFTYFKDCTVMYRVYFRLMSSNLNTRFLSRVRRNTGETISLTINNENSTIFALKQLKWEEINLSDEIKLEDAQPPKQMAHREIDQIIEKPYGKVLLKFRSFRE